MGPQKSKAQKTTIRFSGVVPEAVTDKVQAFFLCSVTQETDSLQLHGLQPTRLLCPWYFPGKKAEGGAIPSSRGSSHPRD